MAVILALRSLGLGDFLTGVPALRGLRAAHPDDHLVLAAPEALRPLVELAAVVDELWPAPSMVRRIEPLAWDGRPVSLAVDLHGRGPESHRLLLRLGPGRLLAFRNDAVSAAEWPVAGAPEWAEDEHEVRRWCRLLEESGIAADPADLRLEPPAGRGARRRVAVVHPGAAAAARRWPADRFAAVARELAREGHEVTVTGSRDERTLVGSVVAHAGLPPTAAAITTLAELAATVAGAAVVISGDTGIAHLATAFGAPSVVLFGPTPPRRWGPPPDPRHRMLWAGTVGDPHGDVVDAGLLRITPGHVLGEVEAALAATRADHRAEEAHTEHAAEAGARR